MKRILLATALMMIGTPTLADEPGADEPGADEPGADCAALLLRINAKLKIIRIRKDAYDEIQTMKQQALEAMADDGDCTTPLTKALRMLGG